MDKHVILQGDHRTLRLFDDIILSMINSRKWFYCKNDKSITDLSGDIYTCDENEYYWYWDFIQAYSFYKENEELILEVFADEIRYGDISELFHEYTDYVDRYFEISNRINGYY
ncbi:hypothetical protein AB3329_01950 [Streptococcus sp. H31]|uniref:hypothetical protein n=1 Tax=Streptococcus huangxiaojuni TaxID=3237239 RepID=UPI0034A19F2A